MARLGKPQRSKKHKKVKAVGSTSRGRGGHRRDEGINQRPRCFNQEIPRKLKDLGIAIKDVQGGRLGKKSKNKYMKKPDGPSKNDNFSRPHSSSTENQKLDHVLESSETSRFEESLNKGRKMGKRKQKLTREAVEEYIDNLKPTRPLVEPFSFKKKQGESQSEFMRRVNQETDRVVNKSSIADQYEVSDKQKIQKLIQNKLSCASDRRKEKLREKKKQKAESKKEKQIDDFSRLQDTVEFGDVVHAPPVLSVLPKKAKPTESDRPGLRMPELKESFLAGPSDIKSLHLKAPVREKGKTIKRKSLSVMQQLESDVARENFIQAYRQMKLKKM